MPAWRRPMALTMGWCCCYLSFASRTLLSNLTCLYSSFPAVMWRSPLHSPLSHSVVMCRACCAGSPCHAWVAGVFFVHHPPATSRIALSMAAAYVPMANPLGMPASNPGLSPSVLLNHRSLSVVCRSPELCLPTLAGVTPLSARFYGATTPCWSGLSSLIGHK